MKIKALFLLVFVFSACAQAKVSSNSEPTTQNSTVKGQRAMVLVELFTSEGCSSCPPADRALALLQKEQPNSDAEVITLAFHVDYWNNLGWKDEFSSDLFTQRQKFYAQSFNLSSIYTPQMVIDGTFEAVGSNLGKVQQLISSAAKNQKANIDLALVENKLQVAISNVPKHQDSTVYLAIAENNLSSSVTRGENAGNQLEHISVVRDLKMLGGLKPTEQSYKIEMNPEIKSIWNKENLKFVVFVQDNKFRNVLGASFIEPN